MFEIGSTVYFKNPSSFGSIAKTVIGPRWCLIGREENPFYTAPIFAATAGILKSKFIVEKVSELQGTSEIHITVVSADQNNVRALVVPDFLTDKSTSSILNNEEKKLLLYYQTLSDTCEYTVYDEDLEEIDSSEEGAENTVEETKFSADPALAFGGGRVKKHNCQSCGKCFNKNSTKETKVNNEHKILKDKAKLWDKMFGEQESDCDDFSDDMADRMIKDIAKDLANALIERLEEAKAKPEISRFMPPRTIKRYHSSPSLFSMDSTRVPEDILRLFF